MYQLQVSFGSVKTDAIYDSARCTVSLFFYNFTESLNETVKSRNVIKKSKNQKNRENTGRFRIDYVHMW